MRRMRHKAHTIASSTRGHSLMRYPQKAAKAPTPNSGKTLSSLMNTSFSRGWMGTGGSM